MDDKAYKQLIEQRKKAERNISEQSLLKIWSYFNSLKNIDKNNLLKNIQRGQTVYYAPLRKIKGSRLINIPSDAEIYIDEKFMQEDPETAIFQVTHECMHGVSLIRDGKQVVFGHTAKGGSEGNRYNGVLEASTQMFAEEAEGKRLPENVDYLYYLKNIMRAMKVLFGEEKLADQFLGNNTDFEMEFNSFSQYKFDDFNNIMSDIYLLEKKKPRNQLSVGEMQLLEDYKSSLNKSVAELINLKSRENPEIFNTIANEIQDEKFSSKLNPHLIANRTNNIRYGNTQQQVTQEESIKDFVLKFMESYKRLETNAQYDKRLDREEGDIAYVAEYVNNYRGNKIDHEYFLGLQQEVLDRTGRIDFSKDSMDRMFRMLNAANNISIGNHKYLKTFCMSSEIRSLIEQMQQSPEVLQMIKRAEKEKEQGQQGRGSLRGLTPAERNHKDAKIAFEEWQKAGYSDNKIFDSIIDSAHMDLGYDSKENFALAKVCCRQRGIKTQSRDLQGKYKLDIIDNAQNQDLIDPDKIKEDTIIGGINLSEINRKVKDFKNKTLNIIKGENSDINR